jgi:predicted secreted Zn-dependent protease
MPDFACGCLDIGICMVAVPNWIGSMVCIRKDLIGLAGNQLPAALLYPVRVAFLLGCLGASAALAQDWQALNVTEPYAISGRSGAELYASIGRRGPEIKGGQRVIAHTNFKLTWTRDYQNRGGGCVLALARPKLTITYVLPKPSARLPADVAASWERFIVGLRAHERRHGAMIEDLVRQIEAASIGLAMADDPDCRKIRVELTRRLAALSSTHQQRSRDFDRAELADGGNVHRLILALVNGP